MEEGKTLSHSECKMTEATPIECMNKDLPFLADEKFDFDLSLSPASENDDEVFVGPMGHKEKCIAVSLESQEGTEDKIPQPGDEITWSPLAGEKFVEIFKEAHLVALQLQSGSKTKRNNPGQLEGRKTETVEKFVQESKTKLKILEKGIVVDKTPKDIKRETYCVRESPVSQLPPAFQKHSMKPFTVIGNYHSPQTPQNTSSPGKVNKLPQTFVTPLAQGKSDKKASAFQAGKNTSAFGNINWLTVEQPKQGKLLSPSSRNPSNSMGSSQDLLSDKSSIASDAGDLSFCNSSSVQDKRTLPTPSKLRIKTRQLKPPSNVHMRRNTSSSSSSSVSSMNSSLNSSLSISPKRGKVQTSVPSKASADSSKLSISKVSVVRPMKVASVASHSDASGKQQRSTSVTKGSPFVHAPKYQGPHASETSGSGIPKEHSDPSLPKLLQKSIVGNVRACSSPKLKTKTVPPVSTKEDILSENVAARVLQPVGLSSCGNIGSNVAVTPPARRSEDGILSNCSSAVKSALRTPASIRHSALPTPVGRRMSGIPTLTPKTVPRLMSSPKLGAQCQIYGVSSKKTPAASSKWVKESKIQMTSSSSSTEEDLSPPRVVPFVLDFSPEQASVEIEHSLTRKEKPAEEAPAKESLLIDIGIDKTPVVLQECENKPLIDLFNTPEIIKAPPLKPTGQLIDLSSPLIRLSPEGNKENLDSPLLKF